MEKDKFSLKNFVKDENLNPTRLPSLKLPRDLRLGGTGQKRKQYTPNLNVSRSSKLTTAVEVSNPNKRIKKQRTFEKGGRKGSKNNNSDAGRFVQTTSVFSEGTGGDIKRAVWRGAERERDDNSNRMQMPKLAKKSLKFCKKEEEDVVLDLLADSECSSDEDDIYQPIVLKGTKNVPSVKKEDVEPSVSCSFLESDKYDESKTCLSLITLPDSFPGKGGTTDEGCGDYPLSDMLEGKIGKLLIRKSGKMEVIVGDFTYALESVAPSKFCEDLMFISKSEDWKSTLDVAKLGQIHEQYLLTPKWDSIIDKKIL